MKIDAIVIQEVDNVATALRDIQANEKVRLGLGEQIKEFLVRDPIDYGHKFAVANIREGEEIFKYGEVIGRATRFIPCGGHAHIQNIESLRGRGDLVQ